MKLFSVYEGKLYKIRAIVKQFIFICLVVVSFGMMLLGKADTVVARCVRGIVDSSLEVVYDVFSKPTSFVLEMSDDISSIFNTKEENDKLKHDNKILRMWYDKSKSLEAENKQLKALLNYIPDGDAKFVSARVIGEKGGAFAKTVILQVTNTDGIAKGNAVLAAEGLAGRISSVGINTSRALLLTDINSKIPVMIEHSRNRAVVVGANSKLLKLEFLAKDAVVKPGDRIVTSGVDGLFPYGLPVGVVYSVDKNNVNVMPFVDFHRLEYVQVVDFKLPNVLVESNVCVEKE
ncbi:MAG: rod shape-determining protein MreC [Alphaproteobacteria bacterium]|nr:rod shape-determining protein MreC [Alphaproteobacteria bacterium]